LRMQLPTVETTSRQTVAPATRHRDGAGTTSASLVAGMRLP
jgi:hypothetical protein